MDEVFVLQDAVVIASGEDYDEYPTITVEEIREATAAKNVMVMLSTGFTAAEVIRGHVHVEMIAHQ